jgi:alpha-L-fucosidase
MKNTRHNEKRILPSHRQLEWHKMGFYGFIHFGINTFTDKEWGYGDESPTLFNPSNFSADQIVSAAAEGGMTGLILTCKHHDGFCLWPSKYTEHSVKNSPWKEGKGDLVREISDSCEKYGLKFGVYLSPWDRNHADYGKEAYIDYYRNQLEELTTQYGEIFEVWFDGANGGDGYYGGANEVRQIDRKTYYDWENTWQIVRKNQPGAVMFSDAGPDIRWVGNEKGIAGDPCWHGFSKETLFPGFGGDQTVVESDMVKAWGSDSNMLGTGDPNGSAWVPAECDVSIRPGWFYHESEDDKVRSAENLMDLYFKSVGRGANFLLNLPPDRRGRIHENDVAALKEFRLMREEMFKVNLAEGAEVREKRGTSEDGKYFLELIFSWEKPINFHVIDISEAIEEGQNIDHFIVETGEGEGWTVFAKGESVGNRRLIRLEGKVVSVIRVSFNGKKDLAINQLGMY